MIWHGTDVAQFQDRSPGAAPGAVSDKPSAPAWFAGDPAFSAHVKAYLHESQAAYMNAYTATQAIDLLAFDDCADLNAHLGRAAGINDVAAANLVLAAHPGIDGYMLEADAVRRQPEYVLFAPGLAKLRREAQLPFTEKPTRWDQGPGEDRPRRHTYQGQTFGVLKGIDYSH